MVPPSIVMVFYGLTVEKSIGDLFLASATPGLMLGAMYIAYVLIRCSINPSLAPPPPAAERDVPLREKLLALRKVVLPVGIIVCVLGSIYGGFAAVSEAAALGAAAVTVAALIRGRLTWSVIRGALLQTMTTCGLLLWLNFGANSLVGVYNLLGGISFLKSVMVGLGEDVSPLFILLIMMLVFFILGMFMDWFSIMLLTMPVFVPTIESFGYDAIWFGVLFNMNMQMAFLTPPFGLAAFYLKSVAPPDISLNMIFSSLLPFIALQAMGLGLVLFFPEIAMWLPAAMHN
jgi:tripartite ATP-independent transporter DctM subunit